ncbi:uncharacterized protein V6R79_012806 [Siganus canaliculatus]
MKDQLTFERENCERIQALANSFGTMGKPLPKPGRILMGEGRLMKQSRRKTEPKDFFLFNDVLVYGSIILNGRWRKNLKIIALEDVQVQDMEDSTNMKNQFLIRTPRKSFFVSAPSSEQKEGWIRHIEDCRSQLIQGSSRPAGPTFAVSWIPDLASFRCMRCFNKFSARIRRHHCRKCGFLVCNSCSKQREVIDHIHPTKKQRVCRRCHEEEERTRLRGDSVGRSSEEDYAPECSDEEEGKDIHYVTHTRWLNTSSGTWEDWDTQPRLGYM